MIRKILVPVDGNVVERSYGARTMVFGTAHGVIPADAAASEEVGRTVTDADRELAECTCVVVR